LQHRSTLKDSQGNDNGWRLILINFFALSLHEHLKKKISRQKKTRVKKS